MVGLGRLELPTSRLSGVRSNHLSYRPDFALFALLPEERETETAESRSSFKESGPIPEPVRCLGRADRINVSADPEGSSLERR